MRRFSISVISVWFGALGAATLAFAQPRDWGAGYPMGWHYMWGSVGIGMFIFMMVFWVLIIAGIVALVRWIWTGGAAHHRFERRESEALEILKARFAKGEIGEEEFQTKQKILRES